MRKLLPQVFEPSPIPVSTHATPEIVPYCQGCVGDSCQFRQSILKEILRCKYAEFSAALDHGWKGLWEFGESHAGTANVPAALPDVTYCFLMNFAAVCRFDSKVIAMMKKELQIIRDWKKHPSI
jgi:hypothetical protein